jgi:hypothetical protein
MAPENKKILEHVRKRPTSTSGVAADWFEQRPGRQISSERMDELLATAREMEEQDPWTADAVRYAGRCFVQANLPHSIRKVDQFATFTRSNGDYTLEIKPDSKYGVPYGTIPRLLLLWIADEVRRTGSPEILLSEGVNKFFTELDIVPTGGRWGTITRLRDQMLRLFNADIRFKTSNAEGAQGALFSIQKYSVWWNRPSDVKQSDLWASKILLSDPLFEELLVHSAPVDMRTVKVLRKSPMELDIYCWLTYRMLTLRRPLHIRYSDLRLQFGAHYNDARNFQVNLDKALWSVIREYKTAKVETRVPNERGVEGWKLFPSPTHVPQNLKPRFPKPSQPAKS